MGVNGCDSFEMGETFTTSGFAPISLPMPVEEQVPCSAQGGSRCVCPQLSVLPLPFLFTKTETRPEEFKPAWFVLLANTGCKPVFLALPVERERQYKDRELKMMGYIN